MAQLVVATEEIALRLTNQLMQQAQQQLEDVALT
jgi:hypothetical protein